jgi:hypothetical protein
MQIQETKTLGVHVPIELYARLESIAREQERSKSQVARMILERELKGSK